MSGKINITIFGQCKFLPNNIPLKVILTRSKPTFCLIAPGTTSYKVNIKKAELQLRRVKINPSILIAHNKILSSVTAKYPISRVEVKSFTIPSGGVTFEHRLFNGQEPVRIIIGLVTNNAASEYKYNPFDFGHFNLNYISLTRNGVPVTTRPLQPKFGASNPDFVQSYLNTFRATGIGAQDDGYHVSLEEYGAGGYVLHCFDLTPDHSASLHQWNLRRNSLIEIALRFSVACTQVLNCIVYAEYQNLIEIDHDRRVSVDF